mgnify:CR=1 FL=1
MLSYWADCRKAKPDNDAGAAYLPTLQRRTTADRRTAANRGNG